MSDTVYTIEQIKNMLIPVFENYQINRAVLFGSYGRGQATKDSDIDLFDITHIEIDSPIDKEIRETGVLIYEK